MNLKRELKVSTWHEYKLGSFNDESQMRIERLVR